MKVEMQQDGSWLASGNGELRPIVAEGGTRREAMFNYQSQYGLQYAEAQDLTHFSMLCAP